MKAKTLFYCTECGNETPKWSGQCPACRAWNTLVERPAEPKKRSAAAASVAGGGLRGTGNRPRPMREVETTHELRFETGMNELDRVLGGGAVKGSLVLVGGALCLRGGVGAADQAAGGAAPCPWRGNVPSG